MTLHKGYVRTCELFHTEESFLDELFSMITKSYRIDVIKLDDWCRANHGYTEEKDGSLSDFVEKKFGKKAEQFVKATL